MNWPVFGECEMRKLCQRSVTRNSIIPLTRLWVLLLVGVGGAWFASTSRAEEPAGDRLFELRTYTTNEGKLEALHSRFRDHTIRLFKKHGMTVIAFWTPNDEAKSQNTLVYMLAYPSLEARKKAWSGFLRDPEWLKAYANSIRDGRLVRKVKSEFLHPTDYSPLK